MQLMIVEDERLLRQGLMNKIDWEHLGLKLTGEASDGEEALAMLEICAPDILITDVRMSGMDGLRFIAEARKKHHRIKYVIISGYDEFEYVREAMKQGVKDYLLKPVDKDKLNALLRDLCREIKEERLEEERLSHLERINELFQEGDVHASDHIYTKLVVGEHPDPGVTPSILRNSTKWLVAVAQVDGKSEYSRFNRDDGTLIRFAVLNIIEERTKDLVVPHLAFKHSFTPSEIIMIVSADEETSLGTWQSRMRQVLDWSAKYLGVDVFVGVGMAKDDFGQIGESYHEAKRALSDSIMKGKSGLYSFADRRSGSGRYETFSDRAERTLLNLLEKSDEEEVMAWIERSFMQLEEDPKAGFTELEFFYREILHIFRKHIGKKGGTRLEWEFPDPTSELRKIANPKELLEQLRVQLRQIIAALNADAERSTQDIVEAVKRFIDENYAEELTLQWVADTYPIHPNYFSRCFKQYWGISFNDYLTRIRIERARALLQSTELKISTISRLVGYEDQNYFCNVFKKQTGISPSAFRNQHPE